MRTTAVFYIVWLPIKTKPWRWLLLSSYVIGFSQKVSFSWPGNESEQKRRTFVDSRRISFLIIGVKVFSLCIWDKHMDILLWHWNQKYIISLINLKDLNKRGLMLIHLHELEHSRYYTLHFPHDIDSLLKWTSYLERMVWKHYLQAVQPFHEFERLDYRTSENG